MRDFRFPTPPSIRARAGAVNYAELPMQQHFEHELAAEVAEQQEQSAAEDPFERRASAPAVTGLGADGADSCAAKGRARDAKIKIKARLFMRPPLQNERSFLIFRTGARA